MSNNSKLWSNNSVYACGCYLQKDIKLLIAFYYLAMQWLIPLSNGPYMGKYAYLCNTMINTSKLWSNNSVYACGCYLQKEIKLLIAFLHLAMQWLIPLSNGPYMGKYAYL